MADQAKGSLLTKSLKKWSRTKTKVLQNLGKAEKTFDERIEEHAHKLEKQQEVAAKLHKELKGYIHCAKAMQAASKNLYQVLQETYEEDWEEYENVKAQLNSLELMWHNYTQSLHDSVNEPLNNYMSHFPTLRQRISKRGRKLTDFDNAKHNLDVHENAKKKDETKIKKAHDELEEAKKIYQQINDELNNDLPMFYDSRVNFYIRHEHDHRHGENGQNSNPAEPQISSKSEPVHRRKLPTFDHAIYENSELEKDAIEKSSKIDNKEETEADKAEERTQKISSNQASENKVNGNLDETTSQNSEDSAPSYPPPVPPPEEAAPEPVTPQKQETPSPAVSPSYETPPSKLPEAKEEKVEVTDEEEGKEDHEDSNLYEVPTSNKPVELPAGVLYQVQATHPYTNEDEDELSFEAGEIIYVIPFDNPDDQDEGWVMGQKKSDGSKGVFPLNFSKKL
ncbi:amphiphysin-like [Saccostrea cucullata]|uniref:amphiphysin-like n=1 Tax=Saccostrea cuccullata TaxID=36930 RepID=UPI002ED13CBF